MNVLDQVRLIVYRVHEKGLEILMLNEESELASLPATEMSTEQRSALERQGLWINLDQKDQDTDGVRTVAVEADWHDIPSIRALIKKDIDRLERKVKKVVPEIEECTYVAIKEAVKKALPHEYAALKELKDILATRNMLQNL